jgi:hypothetical protein
MRQTLGKIPYEISVPVSVMIILFLLVVFMISFMSIRSIVSYLSSLSTDLTCVLMSTQIGTPPFKSPFFLLSEKKGFIK